MDWRAAVALIWAIGTWFVVIVFLGASGAVHKSPELLLGAMVLPLIVLWVIRIWVTSLTAAEQALPMSVYVLMHGSRVLCGIYLVDSGTGLVADWAVPAAITGILIGLSAIPLGLFAFPANELGIKIVVVLWQIVGFLDCLIAPIAAIVLAFVDRGSMIELMKMPTFLISAFIMPLMLWSHVEISQRMWRQQFA
jgi:hypothetical protein